MPNTFIRSFYDCLVLSACTLADSFFLSCLLDMMECVRTVRWTTFFDSVKLIAIPEKWEKIDLCATYYTQTYKDPMYF